MIIRTYEALDKTYGQSIRVVGGYGPRPDWTPLGQDHKISGLAPLAMAGRVGPAHPLDTGVT